MAWVKCYRDSQNLWGCGELSDRAGEVLSLSGDIISLQGMCRSRAGGRHLALRGLLHGHTSTVGWSMQTVGIQHLQQQVIQGHHILALHVVQMLHAFVTHVADVGEDEEELGHASMLLLQSQTCLGHQVYQGVYNLVQDTVDMVLLFQRLEGAGQKGVHS